MAERGRLEQFMAKPTHVLDKGFIQLVDVMGDDQAIVDAARVSYGKGTKTARQNRGLIRYLMRNEHMSPFEMCEIKFHVKAPLFVARQIVRHRTANWNELSARYSEVPDEYYVPALSRLNPQGGVSAQSSDEDALVQRPSEIQNTIQVILQDAFLAYNSLTENGLAREVARSVLPVSTYTQWYWKIDLRNLLHFLRLRLDNHAQWEVRQYAKAIAEVVKQWVPIAWEAFEDYVINAMTISGPEVEAIRALRCKDAEVALFGNSLGLPEPENMSRGESEEFADKIRDLLLYDYKSVYGGN